MLDSLEILNSVFVTSAFGFDMFICFGFFLLCHTVLWILMMCTEKTGYLNRTENYALFKG